MGVLVRDARDCWAIVLQTEHGELAGKFASLWSPRPEPFRSLHTVARRHDDGWFIWERGPSLNPEGQPANFLDVPVPIHLSFYKATIEALTAEDAYAGLILSMHGAGIYKQRYGLQSDLRMRFVDDAADDALAFVAEEEASHAERRGALGISEEEAWRSYRFLQVWDRLSLYVCLRDLEAGESEHVPAVPFGDELGELRLEPRGPWRVAVDPWPFAHPTIAVDVERRLLRKESWENDQAFREAFFAAPCERQGVRFEPS
ncbi:MAG: DUF3891 family protein [Gaiellales bacterium]